MERRTALIIATVLILAACHRGTTAATTPLPALRISCDTMAGRMPSVALSAVDSRTGEGIPAVVFSSTVASGWYADSSGHLTLDLGPGTYHLNFRLIGYRGRSTELVLTPGARCAMLVPMVRDTVQLKPVGLRGSLTRA